MPFVPGFFSFSASPGFFSSFDILAFEFVESFADHGQWDARKPQSENPVSQELAARQRFVVVWWAALANVEKSRWLPGVVVVYGAVSETGP
jgi:hypothetical protein